MMMSWVLTFYVWFFVGSIVVSSACFLWPLFCSKVTLEVFPCGFGRCHPRILNPKPTNFS